MTWWKRLGCKLRLWSCVCPSDRYWWEHGDGWAG